MDGSIVFARWRQCAPHLIRASLDRVLHIPNGILIGSAVFCRAHGSRPQYFKMGRPFSLTLILSQGRSRHPVPWFLGPTRAHNANSASIASAVFARLTIVTDRPTDHATPSVTIHRVTVTYFLHISCTFPPFCGASSAKCLLF